MTVLPWALAGATAALALCRANRLVLRLRAQWRAARTGARAKVPDVPVLFVPGVFGTTLVDPAYGDFPVWGSYRGSFFYRDRYDDLDLPIVDGAQSRLRPGKPLWTFPVVPGLYAVPIFEEFARTLLAAGYKLGDLDAPTHTRALYCLLYDWRRDIVTGARALEKAVNALRGGLDAERIHLVGHSRGSTVIRYYLRYGGADVVSDPGETPRPGAANVGQFFAVGAPYGGSVRAYHELLHGFSPGGPVGRPVAPHHFASCPATYEMLPREVDGVVDEKGRSLSYDMGHVQAWTHFKMGPFLPQSFDALYARARRKHRGLTRGEMASGVESFLEKNLRRSRRLRELLTERHPLDAQVRTVTYTSDNRQTLTKLVLVSSKGRPRLLADNRSVRKAVRGLLSKLVVPGDQYVALEDIKRYVPHSRVTRDPYEVHDGSSICVFDAPNHRHLLKSGQVLTNLLLNLHVKH